MMAKLPEKEYIPLNSVITKARIPLVPLFSSTCKEQKNHDTLVPKIQIKEILKHLENQYSLMTDYRIDVNISKHKDILETSGPLFMYLTFCPQEVLNPYEFIKSLLEINSLKPIMSTLNRLQVRKWNPLLTEKLFKKLDNHLSFKFRKIEQLTGKDECSECDVSMEFTKGETLPTVTNHPAHIIDNSGKINPSSFIPFCWFGNGLDIGLHVANFKIPVCTKFTTVLRKDQICYEIDPTLFMGNITFKEDHLRHGLMLVIDENKDRQSIIKAESVLEEYAKNEIISHLNDKGLSTSIYLEAISK